MNDKASFDSELDIAVNKIKLGEIETRDFLEQQKKSDQLTEVIKQVRFRLMDEKRKNERSIYCDIIRELNDKKSLPLLWDLIKRDNTKGHRGSLVYAMLNMNPIEHLEQLVALAINDNYEVMVNCLDIIDNLDGHVNNEIISKCINNIRIALKKDLPVWKKQALETLLDELEVD